MARLDRDQARLLSEILAEGRTVIRDPRVRRIADRAAAQTGLVESNLRNLPGGDADSQGWRQERASLYPNPRSVRDSARRFYREFLQHYQPGEKSYEVAAQVQRPAAQYRGRYKDVARQAAQILEGVDRGGTGGAGGPPSPAGPPVQGPAMPALGGTGLADLLSGLVGQDKPVVQSAGVPEPTGGASRYLRMAGETPVSSGLQPPREDIGAKIGALSSLLLPEQQETAVEPVQAGGPGGGSSSSGGSGGVSRKGLVPAVQSIDSLAARLDVPITARQEPGHASGGDHDPAVRGATARDFGGSEQKRKALFERLTRSLGVKGAVYKGADINVTRGGIRYQIISRDHGTGPHLHVGLRRVGRS